jgi:hypothetical protein
MITDGSRPSHVPSTSAAQPTQAQVNRLSLDYAIALDGPLHDDKTRQALAEAVALVEYGRTAQARRTLARIATSEPAMAEAWLRTLITQLRVVPDHGRQSSQCRSWMPSLRLSGIDTPIFKAPIN